jgi:ATP-dependent DNA helicase
MKRIEEHVSTTEACYRVARTTLTILEFLTKQKQKMREARGETTEEAGDEAEVEDVPEGQLGKKRKITPTAKAKANKKKKTAAPSAAPPRLPQSQLITGGTLKDYQLDGMNWIIERYIFALFGAIASHFPSFVRLALKKS